MPMLDSPADTFAATDKERLRPFNAEVMRKLVLAQAEGPRDGGTSVPLRSRPLRSAD
jgi:hypothetical protein